MDEILVGKGEIPVHLLARYGNRHGLIAGATGTGKTVTLLTLAEGFSRIGVPVFLADVKGDVAGLAMAGTMTDKLRQRVEQMAIQGYANEASPVIFWDLYGKSGHPVRATVSEIGPSLLSRMLELSDAQEGVLEVVFKLADERGLLLLDLDDLRALISLVGDHRKEISSQYGLVSSQSLAAVQRALLAFEREGGEAFFGEPALELADLMRTDLGGRGIISVLAADQLVLRPRLYSSFLLWLLSELFETFPEVGDLDKPKLVFIFDEAHLLFDDSSPALQRKVEQVVRLIRSKGVGVYFCSQFPDDVPGEILGQLGNRVQHALRAFTPRDQKAVRTAAETFVPKPGLDVTAILSQLGVGEALVSTLQHNAVPMPVERAAIAPPRCRMGAISTEERAAVRARSPVGAKYDACLNRESAYEMLGNRAVGQARAGADAMPESDPAAPPRAPGVAEPRGGDPGRSGVRDALSDIIWGTNRRQGVVETLAKKAASEAGTRIAGRTGGQIVRSVLGSILGGLRGR